MELLGCVSANWLKDQHMVGPSFLLMSEKLVTEEGPLEVKDTNWQEKKYINLNWFTQYKQ